MARTAAPADCLQSLQLSVPTGKMQESQSQSGNGGDVMQISDNLIFRQKQHEYCTWHVQLADKHKADFQAAASIMHRLLVETYRAPALQLILANGDFVPRGRLHNKVSWP